MVRSFLGIRPYKAKITLQGRNGLRHVRYVFVSLAIFEGSSGVALQNANLRRFSGFVVCHIVTMVAMVRCHCCALAVGNFVHQSEEF